MHQEKLTERKNVIGIYCILTRGRSENQRWTVWFMDKPIGKFRTRKLAAQFAQNAIRKAIQDVAMLENLKC